MTLIKLRISDKVLNFSGSQETSYNYTRGTRDVSLNYLHNVRC